MDIRILWAVVIYLACPCEADSLSVKGADESVVERIEFKPRTTMDLTNAKKEMLYGSVIWFKPKQEQDQQHGEGYPANKDKDIIRLKTRKTVLYRRQNKSLKEETENKEQQDKEALRKSKEISVDQSKDNTGTHSVQSKTQKENSDNVQKSDKNQPQNKKQVKRRKNNEGNRRRNRNKNKNKKQNTTVKTVSTDLEEEKEIPPQKKQKTQAQTSVSGNKRNKDTKSVDSVAVPQEAPKSGKEKEVNEEVKAEVIKQIKAKVEEQIANAEKAKKDNPASSDDKNENKSDSEKAKIVQNADLLGLLLAQSDPGLVKILIDNSSPENLNVFLNNSNITVDELKDIVAY